MKKLISTKRGFTIIEVVLVLAVAGLIFLMVFVAVPNMQRSRRDTDRRNAMSRLYTAVENYATNNKGSLPAEQSDTVSASTGEITEESSFSESYVRVNGDTFDDPDGPSYQIIIEDFDSTQKYALGTLVWSDTSYEDKYVVYIVRNATCNGEKAAQGSGNRKFAIVTKLEGSGTYCQSN